MQLSGTSKYLGKSPVKKGTVRVTHAECHQALAALGATYSVMLLLLIIGVVYAARRRTQIREKFGITGSHWGDLCTWFW